MTSIDLECLERDMWRAWNRNGARDAAETILLYAVQDACRAHELLATLDMLPHVREGIASYLPYVEI